MKTLPKPTSLATVAAIHKSMPFYRVAFFTEVQRMLSGSGVALRVCCELSYDNHCKD